MTDLVTVYIEIRDGSKLPPRLDANETDAWYRQFTTVPRYGDAYYYAYKPKPGEWSSNPGAKTALAKAFVVGIEWRPMPTTNGCDRPSFDRLSTKYVVPFVIIDANDPFKKTSMITPT